MSTLDYTVQQLPEKVLRAIIGAHNTGKRFGHRWEDCIFGEAVQFETGVVCTSSNAVVQTFDFNDDEQAAFAQLYSNWDAKLFSQNDLLKSIAAELVLRGVALDENNLYKPLGRVVKETQSAKIKAVKPKVGITDQQIYEWLQSMDEEKDENLV